MRLPGVTRCFPRKVFEVTRCFGVFGYNLSKTSLVGLEPISGLILELSDLLELVFAVSQTISGPLGSPKTVSGKAPKPPWAGFWALRPVWGLLGWFGTR